MTKKLSKIFALLLLTAIFNLGMVHTSDAVLLEIIATPQSTTGFTHNTFHGYDGAGTLSWIDLDTSKSNTYNPDTGDLNAFFNIYDNESFDTLWGTAVATGNIPGVELGSPFTDDLGGNISFLFDFNVNNSLSDYLGGATSVNIEFYDTDYTDTNLGTDVNSWDEPYLSLWGAGEFEGYSESRQEFYTTDLGVDVVFQTGNVVPEPATMLLFGGGMLGAFIGRRKRS